MGHARQLMVTNRTDPEMRDTPFIAKWEQHVPEEHQRAESGERLLALDRAGLLDYASLSDVERFRLERARRQPTP